jgi:hypothetical protein
MALTATYAAARATSAADSIRITREGIAAGAATDDFSTDRLLALVEALAAKEAEARIWTEVAGALYRDCPLPEIRRTLTEYLLRGADDGWSGRGNDHLRKIHDHVRRTIETIFRLIELTEKETA